MEATNRRRQNLAAIQDILYHGPSITQQITADIAGCGIPRRQQCVRTNRRIIGSTARDGICHCEPCHHHRHRPRNRATVATLIDTNRNLTHELITVNSKLFIALESNKRLVAKIGSSRTKQKKRGHTIATHAAPASGIRATAVTPKVPTTRMKQLRITKWGDPPSRSKQISDTISVNSIY